MPSTDATTTTTLEPAAPAQHDPETQYDAVPAVYRAVARLRARWLTHPRLADPALALVLLGLSAAALAAAR
ncbi:hypothetical protein [Kribbella sp. NPDC051620]|uniref:hypothetical protein n=1 Tax=Kribbella sp. NPDC051620 TaxID=3364120 RepID=UPI00378BA12C